MSNDQNPSGGPSNSTTVDFSEKGLDEDVPAQGSGVGDLLMKEPPSPKTDGVVSLSMEAKKKDNETERSFQRKQFIYFSTLCFCFFFEGWNDSSFGPLLPRLQSAYGINYAIVSLIFVFESIGFIGGAVLNVYLNDKLGFGKTIVIGTVLQVIVYVLILATNNFPMWVVAFTIYGFGASLQNAQVNAFVAGMKDSKKMAILHCIYGSGALASPFVATQFAKMTHFSYHYFTALGLVVVALFLLIIVFKFRTQNEILVSCGLPPHAVNSKQHNSYRQIWSHKVVHLLSIFVLVYCGIEVTIGSWFVTYLIHRTGSGSSTGYVSSGFFGGLAAGRIVLLPVTKKIGERTAIIVYALISIGLEALIWALPRFIPSAIAICFVGLFLGPIFPIMMNQCGYFLPGYLLSGAIGWVVSIGVTGIALIPFLTGALSDKYGVVVLQPLLIAFMCTLVLIWGYINCDHWRSTRLSVAQAGIAEG